MVEKPIISFFVFAVWIIFYYFFAWRTYRLYVEASRNNAESAVPLRYFMWHFFWMATFFIFHWAPVAAFFIGGPYANPEWFAISHPWSYLIGHIFMHLSFVYAALLGAHFSWPGLKPYLFAWIFFWGILVGTPLTIRNPQVTNLVGPVITGGDSPIVGMITALGALGMLFAGIVFLYWLFKSKDFLFRMRSLLLGLGFVLFFIGGPLNDSAGTLSEVLFAYTVVVLSILLTGLGTLMKRSPVQIASTGRGRTAGETIASPAFPRSA